MTRVEFAIRLERIAYSAVRNIRNIIRTITRRQR